MLLGILAKECTTFRLRDSHPLRPTIQSCSPMPAPFPSLIRQNQNGKSLNPASCNARRLSHMTRFSLFRVRSPLLTESLLFSLPVGTEMFHFPTFPPHTLYIQVQVTTSSCNGWRGSPIRTPSDQSLVINSPRLIADSYVLLRLLMPRHPPCALKNLTTQTDQKTYRENHENQHHPHTPKGHTDSIRSRFNYL